MSSGNDTLTSLYSPFQPFSSQLCIQRISHQSLDDTKITVAARAVRAKFRGIVLYVVENGASNTQAPSTIQQPSLSCPPIMTNAPITASAHTHMWTPPPG